MTEQETIEKIQEAVPEIMKLELGCKVMVGKLEHTIYEVEEDYYCACIIFENEWVDVEIGKDRKDIKIIGRDIIPIDILKTRTDLAIDGLGGIFERISCDKEGEIWKMKYRGHYEIDKPFHEQSDEAKKFIGNLLK